MQAAVGWSEERHPDRVMNIEGTVIKIYGPGPHTEQEKKTRHDAVVRAVAKCLQSITQQQCSP